VKICIKKQLNGKGNMVTVGIICEYNPFHNGHLYQIHRIREKFGSDCAIIAIMSGNFVQRGEAAILDKWSRTRSAMLSGGINLVIELPVFYATASAELFAKGGVALADATGVCQYLVFGSENGDINQLFHIARFLSEESDDFKGSLRKHLDTGISFPAARLLAIDEIMPDLNASEILTGSNNILAIEYLKAMIRLHTCKLEPLTIQRKGQAYRDKTNVNKESLRSASSIRATLNRPDLSFVQILEELSDCVPKQALAILAVAYQRGHCIRSAEVFADILLARLLSIDEKALNESPGMNEGLGTRLKQTAGKPQTGLLTLGNLIEAASTRRFPKSRVQRSLIRLMLGITNEDTTLLTAAGNPCYLRILGFDKKGQYLLKKMKRASLLPIIMKGSDFLEYPDTKENKALIRMAQLDRVATDIYFLKTDGERGRDFTSPPISFQKAPKPSTHSRPDG
jgi:predicted nucleotidyltransferase